MHKYRVKYTDTKSNTQIQSQIHKYKVKYTSTKSKTQILSQIHKYKVRYTNTKSNPAQFFKMRTSAKPWWSNSILANHPDDGLINAVERMMQSVSLVWSGSPPHPSARGGSRLWWEAAWDHPGCNRTSCRTWSQTCPETDKMMILRHFPRKVGTEAALLLSLPQISILIVPTRTFYVLISIIFLSFYHLYNIAKRIWSTITLP